MVRVIKSGQRLMSRPSAAEIDRFLEGYGFAADVIVERIDIEKNGMFEFFMFAAWDPKTDEVRLFSMWPRENAPMSEWT